MTMVKMDLVSDLIWFENCRNEMGTHFEVDIGENDGGEAVCEKIMHQSIPAVPIPPPPPG